MEAIGSINQYVCQKCYAVHGTVNLNSGTTPSTIACRTCDGDAQSRRYNLPEGKTTCVAAWYRPIPEEFRRLTADEQECILSGQLIIGYLTEVIPLHETPEVLGYLTTGSVDQWLTYAAHAYKPDPDTFERVVDRMKGRH